MKQTRSTFACRWLERGGSLAALQEILKHTTIVTSLGDGRFRDDMVPREAERLVSLAGRAVADRGSQGSPDVLNAYFTMAGGLA